MIFISKIEFSNKKAEVSVLRFLLTALFPYIKFHNTFLSETIPERYVIGSSARSF